MSCQTCADLRSKLIEALINGQIAEAARIAKEAAKHGLEGR
jgi:hypothetical protein